MQRTTRKRRQLTRSRRGERKAFDLSARVSLVTSGLLSAGEQLPLSIEPRSPDVDPWEWASGEREKLEEKLLHHGGILFRGFGLRTPEDFERFTSALCPDLYGDYGDLPKAAEGTNIYDATPYPPEETILFHNESSHTDRWPLRQFFFCALPSERGGETPVVDCRRIYAALPARLRERFEELGLCYLRTFVPGMDVSWQQFFHTAERGEVEARCRAGGLDWEWLGDDGLRIAQQGPATARHPQTGEKVFFNQIQLHHASCLPTGVRAAMLEAFGEEALPRNVCYGDGSVIPDEVVEELLEIYWRQAVTFSWQRGDVLMVDNMLTSHARNPYAGKRRMLVALGRVMTRQELASPAAVG